MEWLAFAGTLVTALGSLLAVIITNKGNNVKMMHQLELQQVNFKAELKEAQAVTDTKITELTREVREHNNFAKRVPIVETELKDVERRVGNLERKAE